MGAETACCGAHSLADHPVAACSFARRQLAPVDRLRRQEIQPTTDREKMLDAPQTKIALVIADSHSKCGAILHWIASEHGGAVRRLDLPGLKTGQDFEVRSVEVMDGGHRVQVIGVLSMALQQAGVAPLLRNVERIVAAVYTPQKSGAAYAAADALSSM